MPTDTRKGKTPCKTRQAHHPKTMSQTSPCFEQRNDPNPVFVQKASLLAKGSSHSGVFSSLHGLTEKALPPAISIPSRISLGQHCILRLPIQQLLRRHPSFFLLCCNHRFPTILPAHCPSGAGLLFKMERADGGPHHLNTGHRSHRFLWQELSDQVMVMLGPWHKGEEDTNPTSIES